MHYFSYINIRLRQVQEKFKNNLFINITINLENMKKLLTVLAILGTIAMTAQEKIEFKQLDQTTVLKTVEFQNGITHIGIMSKVDDKWIVDGVWKQLDENGRETLRVRYDKGRRVWIFKDLGDDVVYLTTSEREDI